MAEERPGTPDAVPNPKELDPSTPQAGSTPSGELRSAEQTPAPVDEGGEGAKEDIGTDLSEIGQERQSSPEKTVTSGAREAHAEEASRGVAGTDMDDETAGAVERRQTGSTERTRPGAAPPGTAPSAAPQPTPPSTTAGGAGTAPMERNPSGTGVPTKPLEKPAPEEDTTEEPTSASNTGQAPPRPAQSRAAPKTADKPATPTKPAEAEPEPAELQALREVAPDLTWERKHGYVEIKVPREKLLESARACKRLGYDYLSAVTGVDWRDRLEMLYHFYSYDYVATPGCIVLRVDLPPEPNPLCPSLTPIWAGAEFQEREVYDLMGVRFVGHPDLRRILTADDFPGHPLRKDWVFDYEYVLVHHLRYGAEGQQAPPGGQEGFRRV